MLRIQHCEESKIWVTFGFFVLQYFFIQRILQSILNLQHVIVRFRMNLNDHRNLIHVLCHFPENVLLQMEKLMSNNSPRCRLLVRRTRAAAAKSALSIKTTFRGSLFLTCARRVANWVKYPSTWYPRTPT